MRKLPFYLLDVFSAVPFKGNPLAVIAEAEGLDAAQMQAIANWTGVSETTFLSRPNDAAADYHVRIFTPDRELPFAGHPTLGLLSCLACARPHAQSRRGGAGMRRGPGSDQARRCAACVRGAAAAALRRRRCRLAGPHRGFTRPWEGSDQGRAMGRQRPRLGCGNARLAAGSARAQARRQSAARPAGRRRRALGFAATATRRNSRSVPSPHAATPRIPSPAASMPVSRNG